MNKTILNICLTISIIVSSLVALLAAYLMSDISKEYSYGDGIKVVIAENYDLENRSDQEYEQEAIDVATSLFNLSWSNMTMGGLEEIAITTDLIDEEYRGIDYVPAVYEMEETAKKSTGLYVGPEDMIDSVIVYDKNDNPLSYDLPLRTTLQSMMICTKQGQQDMRYIDVDGTTRQDHGSTSWLVTTEKKNDEWKVIRAYPQGGCKVPERI